MSKLLGIVYVKDKNNYIFLREVKIDKDKDGKYIVNDIFLNNNGYTFIEGSSKYIDENGIELFIKEDKKYAIYVFDEMYIERVHIEENLSYEETMTRIYNKAKIVVLTGSPFIPKKYTSLIKKSVLTDTEMELFGTEAAYIQNIAPFLLATRRAQNALKAKENIVNQHLLDNIDINEIISKISSKIVGQEETIRTLVCNIYLNQLLINSLSSSDNILNELDSRKVGILLDGATGTGKSAIVKEIASELKLPIVKVDANSFSETGYVGATITDILSDLVSAANGDVELASRGIVVLDEIDKIARRSDYDSSSMKLGVQKELLGFMSGSIYDLDNNERIYSGRGVTKFDTSRLTFILAGAFTDMKESKKKTNIGFNADVNASETYIVDTDDYIEFGLMREFFGRIKVISYLKSYSVEDLKNILLNSAISPLKGFEKTCILLGYPGIEYGEEFIDAIVNRAYEMGTNARALQTIISSIQNIILYDLINGIYDKTKPIKLDISLLEKYEKAKVRRI